MYVYAILWNSILSIKSWDNTQVVFNANILPFTIDTTI